MGKKLSVFSLYLCILISAFLAGCTGSSPQTPPDNKQIDPADYFPLIQGYVWEYEGKGNEYAAFTRKVLFTENGLAQIQDNNGGTVLASVVKSTPEAVTRIFSKGEAYDEINYLNHDPNENTIILKTPIKTGTKWNEPNGSREIVDTNTSVSTPAGTFDECIKVKIINENSTMYEYFKKGTGLVKREFISGDTEVTSSLLKFKKIS